ncbi:MAG TPA: hypothetical protein PLD02_11845 [Saprospiraceae bacterium]|nr:hypothetical protein [Saprospiraceae bacterium]
MAESSFSYDETGFKVKSDNFYFWHYVQYTIFDWINLLCCCTSNWSSCIKIDETREKVVMQLEADRLLRRLNNIERSIKQIMDPYENMIVNILCHPLI